MENPYIPRVPVKGPDMFFGRKDIMGRIFNDIARKQMQSHCVIGERRIGKTSLLNQISEKEIQDTYLGEAKNIIFARTDITLFPDESPSTFFEQWAQKISEVSKKSPPEKPGYLSFRKLVKNVTDEGYKIVILLDEFEATAVNENLDRGFFEFLRALTQNYNISFILFCRVPLQYLMRNKKFSSTFSSPFFNTLNISYLDFLKESEARKLIAEPSQKAGTDISDLTDFILDNAYYHPYLLQQLCYIVFNFRKSSDLDQERILKEFMIQTEDFFTYLWQHSDSDEQDALKKSASEVHDIPKVTMDKLDRRSLLTKDRSRIFCPGFEEFVREKV